jgi:hypothetical protein
VCRNYGYTPCIKWYRLQKQLKWGVVTMRSGNTPLGLLGVTPSLQSLFLNSSFFSSSAYNLLQHSVVLHCSCLFLPVN